MLSRGVTLLVLAWILVGVSSIIVALRLLARAIRECRLAVDDYCMLLAVVSALWVGCEWNLAADAHALNS